MAVWLAQSECQDFFFSEVPLFHSAWHQHFHLQDPAVWVVHDLF